MWPRPRRVFVVPYTALVSAERLAEHLDDPTWRLFDCRFDLGDPEYGEEAFIAGHIRGARYLDLNRDLAAPLGPVTGRHPLPDAQSFARLLERYGVDANTQVVVYDQGSAAYAARLWWMLRWLGHAGVAVLDGGLAAWQRHGGVLETAAAHGRSARFQVAVQADTAVAADEILPLLARGDLLIDARAAERYSGAQEPIDPVAGHIPGAVNLPFAGNLGVGGLFRSPVELRARFEAILQGRAPDRVIHMCGSGVTACHNVLAMEIAGLSGSRLYPGSWSEWIKDPLRPVISGN